MFKKSKPSRGKKVTEAVTNVVNAVAPPKKKSHTAKKVAVGVAATTVVGAIAGSFIKPKNDQQ